VRKYFPPTLTPRDGQLEALAKIQEAFQIGKRFFVLEGPTGFGKSAVAKAALNLYGNGFITSPVNTLVTQYSQDQNLDLTEVRGQSTYQCRACHDLNCELAADVYKDHSQRCMDYIPARDAFWMARQSVTNLHYLYCAPPIDGAVTPRHVLVIDEAHNLEAILISMGKRKISPKQVSRIEARLFDLPGEDKKLLDPAKVEQWLRYFDSAITHALKKLGDEKEIRDYESLRDAINFTLDSGDWITWKEKGSLVIAPLSAVRAAKRLFNCAGRVLFMSATMGDIPLFLKNLGIAETQASVYKAPSNFRAENRKIIYRNLGSMSKQKGQPGLVPMLEGCSEILRERPDERGIIHCHSRALQEIVFTHLQREFGSRILTHQRGNDRHGGVKRLRNSRNGVLCAVAMTEGLDLSGEDARFCVLAKVPWADLTDPYVAERKRRSQAWYKNVTALAIVQGSGRVVRNETDYADTFIFDSTFPMLMDKFPEWWTDAVEFRPSSPRKKLPARAPAVEGQIRHGS
jgi:Rad3-related DNA helicase